MIGVGDHELAQDAPLPQVNQAHQQRVFAHDDLRGLRREKAVVGAGRGREVELLEAQFADQHRVEVGGDKRAGQAVRIDPAAIVEHAFARPEVLENALTRDQGFRAGVDFVHRLQQIAGQLATHVFRNGALGLEIRAHIQHPDAQVRQNGGGRLAVVVRGGRTAHRRARDRHIVVGIERQRFLRRADEAENEQPKAEMPGKTGSLMNRHG